MRPTPTSPEPGQESVWDYPRPPRLEETSKSIQIIFNGETIVHTTHAQRVLETSHPPTYYIPPEDVRMEFLTATNRASFCEWKGQARYFTITVGDRQAVDAAWCYPIPSANFAPIQNYLAFYAHMMDLCLVDGETATPQPGNFYGGWVTQDVIGPFKGEPGSWGW